MEINMQIGRVINLKSFNRFFSFFKENKVLLFLIFLFLFGFGFGVFSSTRFEDFRIFSEDCLLTFLSLRTDLDFVKIAVNSFFVSFTYIIPVFVAGSSVLGVAILPFVIIYRGITYGAMMSFLYNEYSLKGIAYNAVMVLPSAALFVTALIIAARESIGFSLKIAELTLPRTNPANLYYDFKNYCSKYLLICLIIIFSSLIDAFISCYFSSSFSL